MYWDKNFIKFNFTNRVLPSRKLWVELASCYAQYAHVLTIVRMCQNFHCAKKFVEKFSPVACIGEIGENFLLAKLSTYTVSISMCPRLGICMYIIL